MDCGGVQEGLLTNETLSEGDVTCGLGLPGGKTHSPPHSHHLKVIFKRIHTRNHPSCFKLARNGVFVKFGSLVVGIDKNIWKLCIIYEFWTHHEL
jgi:hypothetical protein